MAYVTCCGNADELRIVPITGGASRFIARGGKNPRQQPGLIVWSKDSRSLSFEVRDGDANGGESVVRLAPIDGGPAKIIARLQGNVMAISPDRRLFAIPSEGPRRRMRIMSATGEELGSLRSTERLLFPMFSPDGQRIIAANNEGGNTLKIVSTTTGVVRTIGPEKGNDWPSGWDQGTISVINVVNHNSVLRSVSPEGVSVRTTEPPNGTEASLWRGHLLYEEPVKGQVNRTRLIVQHPTNGTKRVLFDGALGGCCDPVGPGGDYWATNGDELLVRTLRSGQVELRGIQFDGRTRIVGKLPAGLPVSTFAAVHGNKLAYSEVAGDSSYLRVIPGLGQAPRTLLSTVAQPGIGEVAWSNNGRMLAMYTNGTPQRIRIFKFDSTGNLRGDPQLIDSPFEYFYEMFWRPDDSGLSMIVQPKGSKFSEIAVISLANPGNPTIFTKSDAANKWGHSPSPDGKWIAYPSEWDGGGSIVEVDVAKLLKAGAKR